MRMGTLTNAPSIPVSPFPSPNEMLPHLGALGASVGSPCGPYGAVLLPDGTCGYMPGYSCPPENPGCPGYVAPPVDLSTTPPPTGNALSCGWLLSNGVSIANLGITDGMTSWFTDPSSTLSGLFDGNVWSCTLTGGSQWVIGAALMPFLALGALGMVFGHRRRFF